MAGIDQAQAAEPDSALSEEQVRDYLKQHEDFLQRNPDMLDHLHISHASGSAVSLVEKQVSVLKEKFGNGDIPMPDFWGGYRVIPERIEFWQGGEHCIHDRFLYRRQGADDWTIEQLQP